MIARELGGKQFFHAEALLELLPHRATKPLVKLLRSAAANAEAQGVGEKQVLRVKGVMVNQGRTIQRFRPRSRGMAHPIARRSSHITIVLEGPGGVPKRKRAKQETTTESSDTRDRPHPTARTKQDLPTPRKLVDVGKRVFRRKSI